VILDAIGALFPQFSDANMVRRELHRITAGLRRLNVTTLITMERIEESGGVGRFGVEEFVADNVLILRSRRTAAAPSRSSSSAAPCTRRASTRSPSTRWRG
jgi:KaiC/GvpD/RAD55 family RecA-like ATPase